ncbi:MAG: hypothetical protein ACD_8C00047G0015 [uncultured bacterium]|nr:MAG: hypothetical protein ACD_8C00047G0015 [uncultured bacterium]
MKNIIVLVLILLFPLPGKALTLNVVADIHAGGTNRCGDFVCVPRWKTAFQEVLNKTKGIIVTLGDNTERGEKKYATQLKEMTAGRDVYWANGNHDKKLQVGGSKHYSFNKEDWRIVIVDYKNCGKGDVNWPKKQLNGYGDKKVAIFMHYPVFKYGTDGVLKDCKKINDVFKKYKVDYVFSGHRHGDFWKREYGGIKYQAIQGLTNRFDLNYEVINLE